MLGYGDDEIDPHVRAWERLLHPDDRARAEALTDAVLRDNARTRTSSAFDTRTVTTSTC